MLSLLLCFSFSTTLKPLILIPGLYGSPLYAQTNDEYSKKWYCPSFKSRSQYWVDLKLVIPPLYNCIFHMMTIKYNYEKDELENQPGMTSSIEDFGGSAGIEYVDTSLFNWHFIESFHDFADFLRDKGYEFKKNLFGCPYDWRLAMAGFPKIKLFEQIQKLVEEAYSINGKTPVTLLGYSLGGYVSQHFLANYSTPKWKKRYIKRVVFLAPAFGGSGDTLVPSYTHRFPLVKFISSEDIDNALESIPVLHALFPNHVIFGEEPLVYGPDGKVAATASTWGQFLIDHGKLADETISIFKQNLWFNQHTLQHPGVDVVFIFNTEIQTDLALHFDDGYDENPSSIDTVPGDGTVPAIGILWAIENWQKDKNYENFSITAINIKNSDDDFDHGGLGKVDQVAQLIYQYATDEIPKGVTYVTCPHYEKIDGKWVARNDIRKGESKQIEDVPAFISMLKQQYHKVTGSRKLRDEEKSK